MDFRPNEIQVRSTWIIERQKKMKNYVFCDDRCHLEEFKERKNKSNFGCEIDLYGAINFTNERKAKVH